MKLNSREVNVLKAHIEGNSLKSLYNRLYWDTPKTLRLSIEEKDVLESLLKSEYTTKEEKDIISKIIKR